MSDNFPRLQAIAQSVRLQLIEALELRETLTTSQLSRITGDRSLTAHLRDLADAQIIEQVGPDRRRQTQWRLARGDGPVISWTQEQAEDPEFTALIRLVERLGTYRRLDRMRNFDEETKQGVWPAEWAESAIGRDWLLRLSPSQLEEFEDRVMDLVATLREHSEANRAASASGAEDVFLTLSAFPIRLGDK